MAENAERVSEHCEREGAGARGEEREGERKREKRRSKVLVGSRAYCLLVVSCSRENMGRFYHFDYSPAIMKALPFYFIFPLDEPQQHFCSLLLRRKKSTGSESIYAQLHLLARFSFEWLMC